MTAFTGEVSERDLVRLRRICAERSESTMTSFDDLFAAFENDNDSLEVDQKLRPVAIGMFYFEEHDDQKLSIWNS